MRRREFLGVLGGAVAWPLSVRAQQVKPVIGFLRSTTAKGSTHLVAALRRGLNEVGMVEGRNVEIVYRYADGNRDQLKKLAAELVRRKVTVIIANTAAARAVKASTASVPIIFVTGTDPVRSGLVNSFSRPEGMITGIYFTVADSMEKRFGLLHELVPNSNVIAVLSDPNGPAHGREVREVEQARHKIGQKIIVVKCATADKLPSAFASVVQAHAGGLLVGGGPFFLGQRKTLASLAARHAMPTIFVTRQYPEAGGLMSYGPSQTDAYRRAGMYAGQIIKGSKPSDMPIIQSAKFELVINAKTAKTLGVTVPDRLIALADVVIE